MDDEISDRYARAKQRQTAFMEALPEALRDEEDAIPAVIRALNASTRIKLQRIYRLADALGENRAPFVACKKGCASCCHMNITISAEEAARIGAASGRAAKNLTKDIRRDVDAFAGVPCPFLDATGACSVYLDRPLVCRNHASFDEDATLCEPSVMNNFEMPMVNYAGLDEAFGIVSLSSKTSRLADIRDFFETTGILSVGSCSEL